MMKFVCILVAGALIASFQPDYTFAFAAKCTGISDRDKRLACWDEQASFESGMQEIVALELRFARQAALTCGFIIDADRFRMRLVDNDLTSARINDSSQFSQDGIKRIGEDADVSIGATPDSEYCRKAWIEYGPAAEMPDNALYKCRSKEVCR